MLMSLYMFYMYHVTGRNKVVLYCIVLNGHFEVKHYLQPLANLRSLKNSLRNVMGAVST